MDTTLSDRYNYSQSLQKIEKKRKDQIEQMRTSHNDQLKSKEESFDSRLTNVKTSFNEEKDDLQSSYEVTLKTTKDDVASRIQSFNDDKNREFLLLNSQFRKKTKNDKVVFHNKLERVTKSFNKIIESKDNELLNTKRNYEKRIHRITRTNDLAIKKNNELFEDKFNMLEEKHRDEIKRLVKKHNS